MITLTFLIGKGSSFGTRSVMNVACDDETKVFAMYKSTKCLVNSLLAVQIGDVRSARISCPGFQIMPMASTLRESENDFWLLSLSGQRFWCELMFISCRSKTVTLYLLNSCCATCSIINDACNVEPKNEQTFSIWIRDRLNSGHR